MCGLECTLGHPNVVLSIFFKQNEHLRVQNGWELNNHTTAGSIVLH
jgi:hypothetical protein